MSVKKPSKRRQPWAQKLERGLYLRHSLSCPRTEDRNAKRSCACTSYQCSVPNGQQGSEQVTIHEATRAEARARYAQMRSTALSRPKPRHTRKRGNGMTLRDLFVEYAQHQRAIGHWSSEQTVVSRYSHYRIRIDPILGHHDVRDVTPRDCVNWWAALGTKNVASTRRTVKNLLNSVFEFAIDQHYRADNPLALARIKPPKDQRSKESRSKQAISAEDIVEIANAATSDLDLALILMLGFAGPRKGEACALTWDRVVLDAEKPFVVIDRSARWETLSRERQLRAEEGETKIVTARREVPMNSMLVEALRRIRPADAELASVPIGDYHVWPGTIDYIDENGARRRRVDPTVMISRKFANQVLKRAWIRANEERAKQNQSPIRPTSPHRLRHSFVSIEHRHGVEDARIAQMIGDNTETMRRVYMHSLAGEDLSEAVEMIVPETVKLRESRAESA
jgi:integrase